MNDEYLIRKEYADGLIDLAKPFLKDPSACAFMAGSAAHNKNAVTAESGLYLTIVFPFEQINFKEFFRGIHRPFDEIASNCASEKKAGVIMFGWSPGFEVGLNLWDKQALESIVNLSHKPLRILREPEFSRESMSERLISLRGQELKASPNHRDNYEGRVIQKIHPVYEDGDDIYLSAIPNSLLMRPHILHEHQNYLTGQIKKLKSNLNEHIEKKYGWKRRSLSFTNALPDKIKSKVTPELRIELDKIIAG